MESGFLLVDEFIHFYGKISHNLRQQWKEGESDGEEMIQIINAP